MKNIFKCNDIVLLSETWTNDQINVNVQGFTAHILNRKVKHKNSRRDSGGLIVYVADRINKDVHFIKSVEDHTLWLKLNSHVLNLENDLFICLCYNIPVGSSREALATQNIFNSLSDDILHIENDNGNCNFLLTGDFNSRVGERPDYVENESLFRSQSDLLPDDYVQDTYLKRVSQDKVVNESGLNLLEFCKETGVRIVNGRVCEDERMGKFTCVKSAGNSVVDYVLCRASLLNYFDSFTVNDPNILSDHCLISFRLQNEGPNSCNDTRSSSTNMNETELGHKYTWDNCKSNEFKDTINSLEIRNKISNIEQNLNAVESAIDIDSNLNEFYTVINDVCSPLFKVNTHAHPNKSWSNCQTKGKQEWYDDECKDKQNAFYENLNAYRLAQTDESRIAMTTARAEYKTTLRNKRYSYDKNQTIKLEKARFNNAKEYWKMLKRLSNPSPSSTLNVSNFYEYFKSINDPQSVFFQPDEDVIIFNERYLNNELQDVC